MGILADAERFRNHIQQLLDGEIFVAALTAALYFIRGELIRLERTDYNFYYIIKPGE